MAIDRDAMIPSIFFGYGEKSWSLSVRGNKEWYVPDLIHYDYNPDEARKLLAGLGWKDSNGDGVIEDTRGNPVSFTLKTNSSNVLRVGMMNFIRDDLAKIGIRITLAPIEFNTLITNFAIRFPVRRDAARPPEWRAADSSERPERSALGRRDPLLVPTPAKARRQRKRRRSIGFWTRSSAIWMSRRRRQANKEIQTIMNEQSWFIWLPILKIKLPVSNRFGNVQPSVMAHRILWNIDRVYVKPRES